MLQPTYAPREPYNPSALVADVVEVVTQNAAYGVPINTDIMKAHIAAEHERLKASLRMSVYRR